jgi:predicted GIY-YIG superfamily endonuclease
VKSNISNGSKVSREAGAIQGDDVVYVGITKDVRTRTTQHTNSGRLGRGYELVEVESDLTHAQVRGYEQADIEHYKTLDTSQRGVYTEDGKFNAGAGNRARSYDPSRLNDPNDKRAKAFDENYRNRMSSYSSSKKKC